MSSYQARRAHESLDYIICCGSLVHYYLWLHSTEQLKILVLEENGYWSLTCEYLAIPISFHFEFHEILSNGFAYKAMSVGGRAPYNL